ncbi:MAG: GNAT family N-acetyltransferase [Anaerolineaceae bacterium]
MTSVVQQLPESLETERLLIRVPHPGDGQIIHEAVLESQDRLVPWFTWAQTVATPENQEQFVRQAYSKYLLNEDMMLCLFLKENGKFIGGTGLHFRGLHVPAFEIGYWIRSGYEGKGYVIEAVNAITKFGFEVGNANRIYIRCDIHNQRSQSVARRAGYIYEGTFRNFERRANTGELTDLMYFALTRDDYEKMKEQ